MSESTPGWADKPWKPEPTLHKEGSLDPSITDGVAPLMIVNET